MLDDCPVLLIPGHQILDLPSTSDNSELIPVVVISEHSNSSTTNPNSPVEIHQPSHYGVIVDKFLGEYNLVVRPLDSRLGKIPNISAAALMEDGSPVLIIDIEDLVNSFAFVVVSVLISLIYKFNQQNIFKKD